MFKKKDKGFTLTELVVVIVIIGILAVIITPNVIGYIEKARLTTDKNAVSQLNHLLENDKILYPVEYENITQVDAFLNRHNINYSDLVLKTASLGNDIWFDYQEQQFVIGRYEENAVDRTDLSIRTLGSANGSNAPEDNFVTAMGLVSIRGSAFANAVDDYRNGLSTDLGNYFDITNDNNVYQSKNDDIISNNLGVELTRKANSLVFKRLIKEINYLTFINNAYDISEVNIPTSIINIGSCAFMDVTIENINIPSDVNIHEKGAFKDCPSSVNINFGGIPATVNGNGNLENEGIIITESTLPQENIYSNIEIAGISDVVIAGSSVELIITCEVNGTLENVNSADVVVTLSSRFATLEKRDGKYHIMMERAGEVTIKVRHVKNLMNCSASQTFTIEEQKFPNISIAKKELTYNGENQFVDNYVNGDLSLLNITQGETLPEGTMVWYSLGSGGNGINVGTYVVLVEVICEYYEFLQLEAEFEIMPYQLTESDFLLNLGVHEYDGSTPYNIDSLISNSSIAEIESLLIAHKPEIKYFYSVDDVETYTLVSFSEARKVGSYKVEYHVDLGNNYTMIVLIGQYNIVRSVIVDVEPSDLHTFKPEFEPLYYNENLSTLGDYIEFIINDNVDSDYTYVSHTIVNGSLSTPVQGPGTYYLEYSVNIGEGNTYTDTYVVVIQVKERLYHDYTFTYAVGTTNNITFTKIYLDSLLKQNLEYYKVYDTNGNVLGDSVSGVTFASFNNLPSATKITIEVEAWEGANEVLDNKMNNYQRVGIELYVIPGAVNIVSENGLNTETTTNTVLWCDIVLVNTANTVTGGVAFSMSHDIYGNGYKMSYVENTTIWLGNSYVAFQISANKKLQNVILDLRSNIKYVASTATNGGLKHVLAQGAGSEILDSVIYLEYRGIQQWVPTTENNTHVFTIKNTTLVGGDNSICLVYVNDNMLGATGELKDGKPVYEQNTSMYASFVFDNVTLLRGGVNTNPIIVGILCDGPMGGGKIVLRNIKSNLWYTSTDANNAPALGEIPKNTVKSIFNEILKKCGHDANGDGTADVLNALAAVKIKIATYYDITGDSNLATLVYSTQAAVASYGSTSVGIYEATKNLSVNDHIFRYCNLNELLN